MTKWAPTPEILEKIKQLAGEHTVEQDIAKAIGISRSTWWEKKKEHPEIAEAVEEGRLANIKIVRGKLWKIIEDEQHRNHFQAVSYYLNRYDTEGVAKEEAPDTSVGKPTGFTWRIVNADDVKKAKDEE